MSTTILPPSIAPESLPAPSDWILGCLFRMTVDQYERLVESGALDGQHIELINGFLVRKMGKKPPHVLACEALRDELFAILPKGWRLTVEAPVRIPEFDEPETDLAIVRGSRNDYKDRHPLPADIGLLIEVADSSLEIDRGEKWAAYARAGIPAYWVVNLVDSQVEVHSNPVPDGYQEQRVLTAGQRLSLMLDGTELGQIAISAILP
jgi:Uma2 family endonuclease